MASVSSIAATGLNAVTPVRWPAIAAGSNGSSNCTTTGVSRRRDTDARCAATPSASDAAMSLTAPGIGDRPVPVGQFQLGGQRDRPGRLNLDRSPAAPQTCDLPSLFQRVDVFVEQAGRPSRHRAGPGRHPVPARHRVDGDVDQQRTGTPDDVGAHSPGRQLDQMRHRAAEFADDDLGGLPRGGARP